ncbi:MAG: serine/threonine protein kinase [Myxococcales bacterium]|nr:serine/threonine protein kinase [Myxococcales bacterium]
MAGTIGFEDGTFDSTRAPAGEGLVPGAMLSPSIRLFRPLGEGGMGSVWLAEHLALGTPVAVKFLHRSLVQNEACGARFRREALAAARIRSPHVVQILDQGVNDGLPYIVMELLEGETLEAAIERRGRLSLNETIEIVRQVGRVLAKAHDLGVAHRDIKPDNLFLIEGEMEPFVKVIDFGIAKSGDDAGRITTAGVVMGTPQYMSPEQLAGYDVGAETDLWALAVIAYLCLTGSLPFQGDDMVSVATAMAEDQIVPPSRLCDGISPSLDMWFDRAFDANPNRRFNNAREMMTALEHALTSPVPEQRPIPPAAPIARPKAPRPPFAGSEPLPVAVPHGELSTTLPSFSRPSSTTASHRAIARSRLPVLLVAMAMLALLAMGGGAFAWASTSGRSLDAIPNWLVAH